MLHRVQVEPSSFHTVQIEDKREIKLSVASKMIFRSSLSLSSFVERTGLAGGHLGREDGVNSGELRGVRLAGSQ